jgi:hypothetical protein
MGVAEQLRDGAILHTVQMHRVEAGTRRRAIAQLRRMAKEVEKALLASPSTRLRDLQKLLNDTIDRYMGQIRTAVTEDMRAIAELESEIAAGNIDRVLGVGGIATRITEPQVNAALSALTQNATFVTWWNRQTTRTKQLVGDQVRSGVLRGAPMSEMVAAVRGALSVGERQATAVVRTGVMSVANRAREQTYRNSDDLVRGIQAVVTFDTRTSPLCRARSKFAWDNDGNPLPGTPTDIPYPGPPPWHWNCRTTIVAVLKSLSELAPGTEDLLPEETKASMDGQIAADTSYEEWFRAQPEERQEEILGPAKLRLFRKGRLTFADMVDQTGNELTVEQLRQRL